MSGRSTEYRDLLQTRSQALQTVPVTENDLAADAQNDRAWIEVVPDDEWGGALAPLYDQVVDPSYGRVDNIMAIHSLNPRGLNAHNALYSSSMAGTKTLRKVERELIALVVSLENHCHY